MSIRIGIIGAGLSGLTAANDLLKRNKDLDVTVLEANDRVGGRTLTINVDGNNYDMGAAWIGKTQTYAIELAHQAGNELTQQFETGLKVMSIHSKVQTYTSTIPTNLGFLYLARMNYVIWKINRMSKKVPLDNPLACEYAVYWDSMTLHTWIEKHVWNEKVRALFEAAVRVIFGAQLFEISFLYFLYFVHQNGDFENLVNVMNGLQQKKLKEGAQQLSFYLADQVKFRKGKIVLNSFVNNVIQQEGNKGVKVETNKQKYQFDYIIMALPPSSVNKINFSPLLSPQRRLLNSRTFMGSLTKLIIRYPQPYWKLNGFSGQVLTDGNDSPITICYDDTKPTPKGQLQPALLVFIGGVVYRHWIKNQQQLKKQVLKRLSFYFKNENMMNPLTINFQRWDQNVHINGGPIECFPPGLMTMVGDFRRPQGRIHWAGTEMATRSTGYMDGAIQSGKRVALEIQACIKTNQTDVRIQQYNVQQGRTWYTKFVRKQPWFQWF